VNINESTTLLCHINDVKKNKKTVSFEKHILTGSFDKYFTVEISPILSKDGCIGIIILLKDITEIRRNLEIITENEAVLRKERHDFANHLSTLNAMCKLKKPDTLDRMESYISKLVHNSNVRHDLPKSGDTCIDALLSAKFNLANQKNINFDADFKFPLSGIDIDDVDLVGIIGNIIDNAFDAVMGSQNTKKTVSFCTYSENNKAYISVSNNGPKIPESIMNKIFISKFSTKSEKEGERGFGLYITMELINKNMGKIHVNSTESETEFLLEFNLNNVSK
jgi:two-component system, LytTR family, sensor histidine kinase AgrC